MGTIVKKFDEWVRVNETLESPSQKQIEEYISNASNVFLPSFSSEISRWESISIEERVMLLQRGLQEDQIKPERKVEVADLLDSAVLLWGE
jgi:hypothetical protein